MKKILAFLATLIMLIGIIVALTCELNTSDIFDPIANSVPTNIGTHVLVIMLFVIVSAFMLMLFCKSASPNNKMNGRHFAFLGAYAVSGLLFSLASAYQARGNNLLQFYADINFAPGWYGEEFTNSSWFPSLPQIADNFASSATLYYIMMLIAIVITVVMALRAFSKAK